MNLLVNILLYQIMMKKMMIYFSKICYDVRYHPVKNQLKIPLVCCVWRNKKEKFHRGVNCTK